MGLEGSKWSHRSGPIKFQEFAEPETLEAEAALAPKAATRAPRPPTTFSMFAMLFVRDATECVSDMILF